MMKRKAQRGENVESETQDPREREREGESMIVFVPFHLSHSLCMDINE